MASTKQKLFKAAKTGALVALTVGMSPAFAQSSPVGLCNLLTFIKAIIGVVAVLAILMLVINSFFGKSALIGDIVEKVLIGCVVAVGAVALVTTTGLTVSCT